MDPGSPVPVWIAGEPETGGGIDTQDLAIETRQPLGAEGADVLGRIGASGQEQIGIVAARVHHLEVRAVPGAHQQGAVASPRQRPGGVGATAVRKSVRPVDTEQDAPRRGIDAGGERRVEGVAGEPGVAVVVVIQLDAIAVGVDRVEEVEPVVGRERRIDRDADETAIVGVEHLLLAHPQWPALVSAHQVHDATLFADQQTAVGEERETGRQVERPRQWIGRESGGQVERGGRGGGRDRDHERGQRGRERAETDREARGRSGGTAHATVLRAAHGGGMRMP